MRLFKRLKLDVADCKFLVKVLEMEAAESTDFLYAYACDTIRFKLEEYLNEN